MNPSPHEITQLLRSWSQGEDGAIERLMPLVYAELHRLAQRYMSAEKPGHTLQATALVHEAYLRLMTTEPADWDCRTHFYAVSAKVMRRILVDWARNRQSLKRGSDVPPLELKDALAVANPSGTDLVAIDDALKTLAEMDLRKSQVVEMRFFGGLNATEIGEVLKVSEETVHRDWKLAKIWLRTQLGSGLKEEGAGGA